LAPVVVEEEMLSDGLVAVNVNDEINVGEEEVTVIVVDEVEAPE